MRKSKEQKALEPIVDAAFKRLGNRIEFNIFDLGKITKAGETAGTAAMLAGTSVVEAVEAAVTQAIAQYRKN